jgi:cell division protein FtsB
MSIFGKIFTPISQFYYRFKHAYITRENIGVIIIFVLFGVLSIYSVSAMTRNWQQQQQVEQRKLDLARLQAEVATLEYEKIFHQSREYAELLARQKQNMKLPGETMLILPANSESARAKYADSTEAEPLAPSHLDEWLNFFFP